MGVVQERKAAGITDPIGKEARALPADKSSLELGKSIQTELAGRPVTGPLFDFAPAINQLLQSHLFGDLFARDILDYQSREIATVSALSSIEGVDAQLKAHIRIASNVGLTEAQLNEVATVLAKITGIPLFRLEEKEGVHLSINGILSEFLFFAQFFFCGIQCY